MEHYYNKALKIMAVCLSALLFVSEQSFASCEVCYFTKCVILFYPVIPQNTPQCVRQPSSAWTGWGARNVPPDPPTEKSCVCMF